MSTNTHSTVPGTSDTPQQLGHPIAPHVPQRSIAHIIWDNRWVVVLVLAVSAAAGLTYLIRATPLYTSSSRLFVERNGPEIITANEGFMTQSKNYLYTQSELLKSTPILSATAKRIEAGSLRTFPPGVDPETFLKKELDVEVGRKDDIITVSIDSPYPQEAADIVNALVESYIAYHSRQKRDTSGEILKILQREKVKRDAELRDSFESLMEFKRENGTISFGADNSNIIIQRLVKLSGAVTEAELEMMEIGAEYETTKSMLADPGKLRQFAEAKLTFSKYASSNQEMGVFRADLDKLQLELAALRQECTSRHPAVAALQAKVKCLSAQRDKRLAELAGAYITSLEQKCLSTRDKVVELCRSFDQQRALAQELNSRAVQYAMLEADMNRTERLCDLLDDRIKEIDINEDAGALNISILETARACQGPSHPRKARVMTLALFLGLAGGAGLSLLRNWADHRLRSAEEASEVLGLPVLGMIPHVTKPRDAETIAKIVHADPTSQAAESYRTVRTALYFGVPNGQAKTVLITSPAAGDGKTTLASNLGIAMAQAGQKVLVLDADFRRPAQHKNFRIEDDSYGLCGALTGRNSLDQAIRGSSIEGLDILPCGPVPPNPSEMLNSRAFARLLGDLAKTYDHILLDAPPVIPVADARILGAISDVAILVLRAEKSSRRPSQQAVEALLKVRTQILGIVVNDAPAGRGYYDDYHYGYGGAEPQDLSQEREEVETVRADAA